MEYIDIRSDTVTMPTSRMVQAIQSHSHNHPNEDPVLESLINKAITMFGMEAAMLLPSGRSLII